MFTKWELRALMAAVEKGLDDYQGEIHDVNWTVDGVAGKDTE